MGYTTEFSGSITVEPPLNAEEIAYLNNFAGTRRMHRRSGPYYCGTGMCGQDLEDDIINYNNSGDQPGLWCQWVPTEDGTAIQWDQNEKFYNSVEWMQYIIDHFLAPGAKAQEALPFLQANHVCSGVIKAQGEDMDDRWKLVVENNAVQVLDLE